MGRIVQPARKESIVKLFLLFPLVMAAIGLCAAPDSGTLTVDGEVVHYGDWDSVKQQYKPIFGS